MRANKWPIAVIGAFVFVAVLVLGWQRQAANELRGEIARQRALGRERARLTTENQRLTAAQASAEELDRLLAERKAVAQLRAQLETMQRRTTESTAARRGAMTEPPKVASLLNGNTVAYQLWQNAGAATPDAAFETVLWASAGGDIDRLVELLAFAPEARDLSAAIFAQLPAAMRKEFATPERLIAVLTAKDVPLGRAAILRQNATPTDTKVTAQIFDAAGNPKVAQFSLRAEGDRWRLVVPVNVVKRYAAALHPPLVTTLPLPTGE